MSSTNTVSKQKERSDLSTKRLLEAAGELIVEGGYQSMTLAAVGERAGYSRGLATVRFGSKDQLLAALVDRIIGGWNHRNLLPRTVGHTGGEAVVILIEAIARQAEKDPSALRVLYALMFEALGPVPELKSRFADFHHNMRADMAKLIRKGIRDGSIDRGVSTNGEAAVIVGALRGIAYQWRLDPDRFDPVPALRYLASTTGERIRNKAAAA